jgi:hypothetical protein
VWCWKRSIILAHNRPKVAHMPSTNVHVCAARLCECVVEVRGGAPTCLQIYVGALLSIITSSRGRARTTLLFRLSPNRFRSTPYFMNVLAAP